MFSSLLFIHMHIKFHKLKLPNFNLLMRVNLQVKRCSGLGLCFTFKSQQGLHIPFTYGTSLSSYNRGGKRGSGLRHKQVMSIRNSSPPLS